MDDKIFDQVHDVDLEKDHERILHRICYERYCFKSAS